MVNKLSIKIYLKRVYDEFQSRFAIPFFVCFFILFLFSQFFAFAPNISHSLPGKLYLISKKQKDLSQFKHGDFVAYTWQGGSYYPQGTIFIKKIGALSGDVVTQVDREFFARERSLGIAKERSLTGEPLETTTFNGEIPNRHFWAEAENADSLDSRYELSGLIGAGQIVGKAYQLF